MTRDDAVAHVKRRLGFFTKRDNEIVIELQTMQRNLENGILIPQQTGGIFLPWFLVSEMSTHTITSGEERIVIPEDMVNELEEGSLWLFEATAEPEDQWKPLSKDDLDYLKAQLPGEGEPKAYATSGFYFRLKPTPDAASATSKVLKMMYRERDAVLTTPGSENKWLLHAPLLLVGEAGLAIASSLRDTAAVTVFNSLRQEEAKRLFLATEMRLHVNRRYVMGGED